MKSFQNLKNSVSNAIAVLGGSFDPPHLGHQDVVRELEGCSAIREIRVLPAGRPPLKDCRTPAGDRLELCRLGFSTSEKVRIDTREIERERPSTTFETLSDLRKEISPLIFVIGTDQLLQLDQWHRFPEVLGLSHWLVLSRQGVKRETVNQTLAKLVGEGILKPLSDHTWSIRLAANDAFLFLEETDAREISSSEIRAICQKTGSPPEEGLDPKVRNYILENHIYGS